VRRVHRACAAAIVALAFAAACESPAHALRPAAVEHGSFALHKLEQRIGEERWEIMRLPDADTNSFEAKIEFELRDRGPNVTLNSDYRCRSDWTPLAFAAHGKTSRSSTLDDSIDARGAPITVEKGGHSSDIRRPGLFFTIDGYAPVAMQMFLMRYWLGHGEPAELVTIPSGRVHIRRLGCDTLEVGGTSRELERYSINGLAWGHEDVWMDADQSLVALITVDGELFHFEAVRDDFEPALEAFVERATADRIEDLASLARSQHAKRSTRLAIVGARLIDGTGAPPISDSAVLIEGGRITEVGRAGEMPIPSDAEVIEANGRSLLPGLWDMHAHYHQIEWGPVYLAAGVTTVRDCGNEPEFITAVRDEIASGRGIGPRILAAGLVDGSGPHSLGIQRVDTDAEARAWVNRYHALGFQQIKVYESVKLEILRTIAAEAHKLGMTVTGHVPNTVDLRTAVEAGQDQISHFTYVWSEAIDEVQDDAFEKDPLRQIQSIDFSGPKATSVFAFLKAHGTVVDPTMAIFELGMATKDHPAESFEPGVTRLAPELNSLFRGDVHPAEETAVRRAVCKKQVELIGALHRAGVPIVAGTDVAMPGHSLHREIELYVEAGFTPLEAIQAATIVPARVMNLDREIGTVEVGKRADMILIDGDPLVDIHAIRRVRSVITGGTVYECAPLWTSVGFEP
jgi:imidazolonepropionase-like amidohydrolase